MRAAKFCIILALLSFAGAAFAEPKAYELIRYRGTAEGLTIAFDFGDGYVDASEIRIKQGRSGKSRTFRLFGNDEMRFVPVKKGASDEEVTLEMSPDEAPGEKVKGTYRTGGKTIRFTLAQVAE